MKRLATVRPVQVAGGQVGREALAEPDVRPVALGNGVAEPLVGDLVRDQTLDAAFAVDRVLVVEHVAGILQTAPAGRGLHVGELGVGVVPEPSLEGPQNVRPRSERPQADFPILRVDPDLHGHTVDFALPVPDEARYADRGHLGGDGSATAPLGAAHAVAQVDRLDEGAGSDDLVVRRRRDDERNGRLVRGMIDDRQPVVRPIRPVVGEEGPLAVAVRADREAVGRDAAVADLDAVPFAGRGPAVQRHEEPVVLLPELEGRVGEGRRGDDHAAGRPAVAGFFLRLPGRCPRPGRRDRTRPRQRVAGRERRWPPVPRSRPSGRRVRAGSGSRGRRLPPRAAAPGWAPGRAAVAAANRAAATAERRIVAASRRSLKDRLRSACGLRRPAAPTRAASRQESQSLRNL